METKSAQTEFVRRALEGRPPESDEGYARDLLLLERLAATRPLGLASSLTLSNLLSRYPREADAIARELGMRPFEPLEDERMRMLASERLRLAEIRQRLGRPFATELSSFFEF